MKKLSIIFIIIHTIVYSADLRSQTHYALDMHHDIPVIYAGMSLVSVGLFWSQQLEALDSLMIESLSPESQPFIDRYATQQWSPTAASVSDVLLSSLMILPLIGVSTDSRLKEDDHVLNTLYLESILLTFGGTLLTKNLVKRPRPYILNANLPYSYKRSRDGRQSFFSGHSSLAFTSAVFISSIYDKYHPNSDITPWIQLGCLGSASFVAYLRIKAGKHYLTDVITGAIFGTAITYIVLRTHEQKNNSTDQINKPQSDSFRFNLFIAF
ncbi:phosphatase PAP2 family protein [candidate division KSB1 bacterium]|nr:phosphatase PAP2 family protein [candidate division KSB1 bacterium]